ncbi:hypothetical protein B23_2827 [Geobacillus thermoleovorans B23]|nr:hypothetical protein B23_2827 [Geobacillus thermoleovorans B23]
MLEILMGQANEPFGAYGFKNLTQIIQKKFT